MGGAGRRRPDGRNTERIPAARPRLYAHCALEEPTYHQTIPGVPPCHPPGTRTRSPGLARNGASDKSCARDPSRPLALPGPRGIVCPPVADEELLPLLRDRLDCWREWGQALGVPEAGRPQGNVTGSHVSDAERKQAERARSLASVPDDKYRVYREQAEPDRLTFRRQFAERHPSREALATAVANHRSWTEIRDTFGSGNGAHVGNNAGDNEWLAEWAHPPCHRRTPTCMWPMWPPYSGVRQMIWTR